MNISILRFAAAFGLVALPSCVSATGITYDCDTASGHFSELILPAPGNRFTVTGNLQLNAIAPVDKYAPLARLQIASESEPGQSPTLFAGFTLTALPVDAKKNPTGQPVIEMLAFNVNGKDDDVLPSSMIVKPGTVVPFVVSFDGSNVSVKLNDATRLFPLGTTQPVVRLVCSTGEFLFTNLAIKQ